MTPEEQVRESLRLWATEPASEEFKKTLKTMSEAQLADFIFDYQGNNKAECNLAVAELLERHTTNETSKWE